MAIVLGAIADDFTGATDLAGLLARSGYPVSLRFGLPDETEAANIETSAPFEIIALKCRTIPVDEAVAQVRAAYAWLKAAGAQRFYWKYCSTFDSTAEGNIGPVSQALMADIGTSQTIYCPAFPENGRSIFMGHLFVGEQPLDESPMKDHPLTPMRDSSLVRLLQPQVKGKVGLANRLVVARGSDALKARLAELAGQGVAHVIIDAVADGDLGIIAEATLDLPLLTGGSALAMPLPRLLAEAGQLEKGRQEALAPVVGEGKIVLSGSCSAMTLKQVAHYKDKAASYRLDPLELAEHGAGEAMTWLRQRALNEPKLIYASADPASVRGAQEKLGVERAGQIVEETLAALAREAFSLGIRRFVVAGGETSGAVAQALGVSRVMVGQEIAPGVPWTFATVEGGAVALALKSGNFGSETFFETALRKLEAA
ncbi:four-carbon acid sugar kinase family protein [Ochrobactrum sp. Q0168]|uniref:3-oxo-tetronate kinase n=1 Tax=Ochrobactrum sp. Q0168 TaxID=2793241 RepID=UPI0018EAB438|nr:four-carbon acid sugar kinase family protein [Ochrobactrum sp. Q0168]